MPSAHLTPREFEDPPEPGLSRETAAMSYTLADDRASRIRKGPGLEREHRRNEEPRTAGGTESAPKSERRGSDGTGARRHSAKAAAAGEAQANDGLGQGNHRALEERLAKAGHELRTPLNAILGFAEAIMSRQLDGDPDRCREYGRYIYDSSVHLLELIESLVEKPDLEDGHHALDSQALDIVELTAGALRIVKNEAQNADVALLNDLPDELPMVRGNRRAVRQILLNLISNAIKYTPAQGAVGVEGEGVLRLTIWDTGVGIAADQQEKVFQPSYRAPEVRDDKPGSGVGLAIARSLARAMDGEITIDSEPGRGSRISLWLPLECGEPTASPDPEQD